MSNRRCTPQAFGLLLVTLSVQVTLSALAGGAANVERHLLYVATPGIRDDVKFGGAGIVVFDKPASRTYSVEQRGERLQRLFAVCGNEGRPVPGVQPILQGKHLSEAVPFGRVNGPVFVLNLPFPSRALQLCAFA